MLLEFAAVKVVAIRLHEIWQALGKALSVKVDKNECLKLCCIGHLMLCLAACCRKNSAFHTRWLPFTRQACALTRHKNWCVGNKPVVLSGYLTNAQCCKAWGPFNLLANVYHTLVAAWSMMLPGFTEISHVFLLWYGRMRKPHKQPPAQTPTPLPPAPARPPPPPLSLQAQSRRRAATKLQRQLRRAIR